MSVPSVQQLRAAVLEPRGLGTLEERQAIWYALLGVPRPRVHERKASSSNSSKPPALEALSPATRTTSPGSDGSSLQEARSSLPTIQFGTYTGSDTSFDDSESLGRPESTLGSGSATTESQHASLVEQLKPPTSGLALSSSAADAEEWQTVGKRRRAGSRANSQPSHGEDSQARSSSAVAEFSGSPARVTSPNVEHSSASSPTSKAIRTLSSAQSINRFDALRGGNATKSRPSSSPMRMQKSNQSQKRSRAGSQATSVASSAPGVGSKGGLEDSVGLANKAEAAGQRIEGTTRNGATGPSALDRVRQALASSDSLPPRDAQQVELDVNRSFLNFRTGSLHNAAVLAARRRQLSTLCTGVLKRRKALSYYQGYHDVLTVILLTLLPEVAEPDSVAAIPSIPAELHLAAERLSLHWLRDAMTQNLDATMGQLRLLSVVLRKADAELADVVERAFPLPYFALPWLITLLTHSLPNLALAQRVLDFVLVYGPMGAVYLCVAIVQLNKESVLAVSNGESDPDDFEAEIRIHQALAALPTFRLDDEAADLLPSEADDSPDSDDQFADAVGDESLYDDPDVFGPADSLSRSASSPEETRKKAGKSKSKGKADSAAIPISRLLAKAADLLERQEKGSDFHSDLDAIMGPGSTLRTWDSIPAVRVPTALSSAQPTIPAHLPDDSKWDQLDERAEYIVQVDSGAEQLGEPDLAATLVIVHPAPPAKDDPPAQDEASSMFDEKHGGEVRRPRLRVRASHKAEPLSVAAQTTTVTIAALGVAGVLLGMYAASNGGASVQGLVAAGAGDRAEQARGALALVARMLSLMH